MLGLTACTSAPTALAPLLERPAERALSVGIAAYDDGQPAQAEVHLERALQLGLAHPQDRAAAYKRLAFIQCTTQRVSMCEASFRSARAADPAFALTRAEAGHPLWGPVFRRLLTPPR
jgi:Tfp pilus assembly protein PilF